MTLATVQQILARLYTHTELRQQFFLNPEVVGQQLGLNSQEIQQLSQLSRQQVELFARSLKHKRLGEVRKLLPLTHQSLGQDFTEFFWQYAETFCPTGLKKHKQDAVHFCTFLERIREIESVLAIVRAEKMRLQATDSNYRLSWHRFRFLDRTSRAKFVPKIQITENQ